MMRIPRRTPGEWSGINMTPMIDVVFLLVIFFLLSRQLTRDTDNIDLALPSAKSGTPQQQSANGVLTVQITSNGQTWRHGRQVGLEEIARLLEERHGSSLNDVVLRLRCDERTEYRHLETLLSRAATLGIGRFTLAVQRELKSTP